MRNTYKCALGGLVITCGLYFSTLAFEKKSERFAMAAAACIGIAFTFYCIYKSANSSYDPCDWSFFNRNRHAENDHVQLVAQVEQDEEANPQADM